jgi:phosphonate transport system ATP-binding protein
MINSLKIRGLNKHFTKDKQVLREINLDIASGEMVALIGASGSGKSTLLRLISGLTSADSNCESLIEVQGQCVQKNGKISADIRIIRSKIGFVFQQFNLVDRLSVLTNVLVGLLHTIPLWRGLLHLFFSSEKNKALQSLRRVGIEDCYAQRASTLSGGQQQRAAIARAMVQGAGLILADEPIASLDPESSRNVLEILSKVNKEDACTVLVSLHQVDFAKRYFKRIIGLKDGSIVFDGTADELTVELLKKLYGSQADELFEIDSKAKSMISPANEWHFNIA